MSKKGNSDAEQQGGEQSPASNVLSLVGNQEPGQQIEGITIFCPLCTDFLAHSVTTFCEHTFCELCIQQYLLFIDECPECRLRIRSQRQASNILLDNLVLDYIKRFQPSELAQYERRLEGYKEYKRNRVCPELEAGMVVDIRDPDYVWCTGKVIKTTNKYHEKKIKYAIIKYDKGNKKEEIPEGSQRIATKGFFTAREDLPKYERGKLVMRNVEQGVAYIISKQSDDSSEQKKREA